MGSQCCSEAGEQKNEEELHSRLDIKGMSIVEFERRVKRYASPNNKGKISVDQLMESFRDTHIFENLKNPQSVVNKLVTSPFFTNLTLTHNEMTVAEL